MPVQELADVFSAFAAALGAADKVISLIQRLPQMPDPGRAQAQLLQRAPGAEGRGVLLPPRGQTPASSTGSPSASSLERQAPTGPQQVIASAVVAAVFALPAVNLSKADSIAHQHPSHPLKWLSSNVKWRAHQPTFSWGGGGECATAYHISTCNSAVVQQRGDAACGTGIAITHWTGVAAGGGTGWAIRRREVVHCEAGGALLPAQQRGQSCWTAATWACTTPSGSSVTLPWSPRSASAAPPHSVTS